MVVAVCHGPRCGDYGGKAIAEKLQAAQMCVEVLACQSLCPHAPIVRVSGSVVHCADVSKVEEAIQHVSKISEM